MSAVLISTLILLSGCSGNGNQNDKSSTEKMQVYETEYVTMSYPQDWEIMESKDFPTGTPPSTIVIFKANIKNELFIANVNVAHGNLPQSVNPGDYAKQVIANQKATLQNYKELNREEVQISINGNPVNVTVAAFEGKRIATDPIIRFIQLYAVKDTQTYIATAAMLPTEEQSVQYAAEDIVKSLNIK